ncbi:hypothetical protein M407DRAFT_24632 [Tulasnella calospora MUT 4182]|uniref:Transmembrane protein n=1 Tax=Tulasnella calospora MUT 4182 TaxID=1051891 RepID=A0A0C3KXD1_9AGAM|nr:hypothetical protein M407DRAFT_24632 [Tulasnella calospora MUT 4182]
MSCVIHRVLALSFFFFLLLLSLTAKAQTVASGRLPSLPLVVPSGVAPAFPILDFVLWQRPLEPTTSTLITPKRVDWALSFEFPISGAPREPLSSHLNSFSTLKVAQHVTTAFDSRVTPPALSPFSKADTVHLSSSPGVTLGSPPSNTTASTLYPRSHVSVPLSTSLLFIEPSWPEASTRNRREVFKRYALLASLLATLVSSVLPVVLHCDAKVLNTTAVLCSSSKQRVTRLVERYHVTILQAEAHLANFSKNLDRVGQVIVRSFRVVGLLDRDVVSIGYSIEDDSLPPWPDFGEPDAEWPPSRRRLRSRSYDSPYMDSPFISLPWAEHHRAETLSTQSSRASSPSPDDETLSPPSPPPPPPLPPTPDPKPKATLDPPPICGRKPDPAIEQLMAPRIWGYDLDPVESWFDDDAPREIKPYPWELPPLFVDEEEEELERLSKGYENDPIFIRFEANPRLLKRYLLDPEGFRAALPPRKKENDSWKLRGTGYTYDLPVSKEDRPAGKASEPALDEQSMEKSESKVAKKQEQPPEEDSSTPTQTQPTSEAGDSKRHQQNAAGESTRGAGSSSRLEERPQGGSSAPTQIQPNLAARDSKSHQQTPTGESTRGTGSSSRLEQLPQGRSPVPTQTQPTSEARDSKSHQQAAAGESTRGAGSSSRLEQLPQGGSSAPTQTQPTSEARDSKTHQRNAAGESTRGAGSLFNGASKTKPISRRILSAIKKRRFGFILPPKK